MSVISRYFIKQAAISFMAVVVILLAIIVGSAFIRLLGQVADGKAGIEVLLPLLGLSTVSSLSILMSVSLFLAVLVTLGRLYADSEITALKASGMGSLSLMKPFLFLGLIIAFLQTVLVLWLVPESERAFQIIKAESVNSVDLGGITPGRFVTLSGGERVVYAEVLDQQARELNNIYLFADDGEEWQVISAASARQAEEESTKNKYLELMEGQWLVANDDSLLAQHTLFESMGLFIPGFAGEATTRKAKTLATRELMESTSIRHKAELQWRIASPVMVLFLVFLAVPLSHTSPRKGRFAAMAVAVVSCIAYFNLLAMAKGWMSAGVTPQWLGLWWIHVVPFLGGMLLLWKQGAFDGMGRASRKAEPQS